MAQLDFIDIITPYCGEREPEEVLASLRAGMEKKFPVETVDSALSVVFARVARGKSFPDLRAFAKYCEWEAHKQTLAQLKARNRLHQVNANRLIQAATDGPVPWRAVVPWTLLGAVAGFVGGWIVGVN